MLDSWIGEVVGKMHIANIEGRELAQHMGVTAGYISMLLNGKRSPSGAEQRIKEALDELIREKES